MKDFFVSANGISLHVVQEGVESEEPVIMLHVIPSSGMVGKIR